MEVSAGSRLVYGREELLQLESVGITSYHHLPNLTTHGCLPLRKCNGRKRGVRAGKRVKNRQAKSKEYHNQANHPNPNTNKRQMERVSNHHCHQQRNLSCSQHNSSDPRSANRGRDVDKSQRRLRSTPASITVATFNCRTLISLARQSEMCMLASDRQADIVALQEHRIVLSDTETEIRDAGKGWTLYLVSARSDGVGGVGFLVSPQMAPTVLRFDKLHERIASLRIQLQDNCLHLLSCYFPTACSNNLEETTDCLDVLTAYSAPSRDVLLMLGDLNADIPVDGLSIRNKHGKRQYASSHTDSVTDYITSNEMIAANGVFRQKQKRLFTFYGPRRRRARLDYILLHQRWKHLVRRVSNIRPRCVTSDHTFLSCNLSLKLWKPKPTNRRPKTPNWAALSRSCMRDRFEARVLRYYKDEIRSYSTYVDAIKEVGQAVLPKRKKIQQKCLWDDDDEVRKSRQALLRAKRENPANSHSHLESDLAQTYIRRQSEIVKQVAAEISKDVENGRCHAVWQGISKLTGRKIKPPSFIASDSIEERIHSTSEHFRKILNQPRSGITLQPPLNLQCELPMKEGHITAEELGAACKSIASNKSAGYDEVPSDVVRLPTLAAETILPFFNEIIDGESPPKEFLISIIVPISKKSGSTTLDNQRGISLMSYNAKLFNRVMLMRLRECLEDVIYAYHAGFRPERNAVEQILCLRIIIDTCKSHKRDAVIIFVDYSKAFDSVDRNALEEILAFYCIPSKMIHAIMSMYTNTTAYVRCKEGDGQQFPTTSGVLQGDTLAPYLFVIVMDYVMRMSLRQEDGYTVRRRLSSRYPAVTLPILAFADDAALISNDKESAQAQFKRFEEVSSIVGLKVNALKTKIMFVGAEPGDITSITGSILPVCADFTYLGNAVSECDSSFRKRHQLACYALNKLAVVWKSGASTEAKVRLFTACVETVLFYSGSAWTVTRALEDKINAAHRALLRVAIDIRYPQRINNVELYTRTGLLPATTKLRRSRMALYGHALRRPDTPLATILRHRPTDPRRQGRPRKAYFEQIEDDLLKVGITIKEAASLALNRDRWRNTVNT